MAAPAAAHPDPADNDGPAQRELRTDGLLDCTVCLEFLHGHVYQCDAGHIICVRCYSQLQPKRCPSCKTMYSTTLPIRNRAVERIAEQAVALGLVPRAPHIPPAEQPRLPRQTFRVRHFTFEREPRRAKVRHGVTCDGPQCIISGKGVIEGVRFLCSECPESFDLCQRCAKDGVHGHHLLIRIDNPSHANQMEKARRNWRNHRLANEGQADTRPIARPVRRVVLLRPRLDQPPNTAASSAPNAENDARSGEDDMDHDGSDAGGPADVEIENGANVPGDNDGEPGAAGEDEDNLENESDENDDDSEIEIDDGENNSEVEDEDNSENDWEGDVDESQDEDDIFGMRAEE